VDIVWKSLVLACVGTLVLKFGGRKSISQMTIPQLAIVISLGAIIGGEVSGKGIWNTVIASATFVAFLVGVEWITLHWNRAEKAIKGMAIPIISDGKLMIDNLRKLRISVDDVEKRLRMAGISRIEDVEIGTIENNGELGYKLMPHASPVTMGDLEKIMQKYFPQATPPRETEQVDIFDEIIAGTNSEDVPRQLH
jgi:uncharacterized membrane protein YcaP (DUF421 family)